MDGLVIVGTGIILWVILFPILCRPTVVTRLTVSPLSFKDAELQAVMRRLDQELRSRHGRTSLQRKFILYQPEQLKHRKVSLKTHEELPLKTVLRLIEPKAHVYFEYGTCGTCGGWTNFRILDESKRPASRAQ